MLPSRPSLEHGLNQHSRRFEYREGEDSSQRAAALRTPEDAAQGREARRDVERRRGTFGERVEPFDLRPLRASSRHLNRSRWHSLTLLLLTRRTRRSLAVLLQKRAHSTSLLADSSRRSPATGSRLMTWRRLYRCAQSTRTTRSTPRTSLASLKMRRA